MTTSPSPLEVIEDRRLAATVLRPPRLELLDALREPDSAAGLARRLGSPRQRLNHHLRELEEAGLVELVEERRRGNCTERILRASAGAYLIGPAALGAVQPRASVGARDRFSWAYLIAAAARTVTALWALRRRADRDRKRIATLTLETEIVVDSPSSFRAMSEDLTRAAAKIAARYHDESAEGGRRFRLLIGAHPAADDAEEEGASEAEKGGAS